MSTSYSHVISKVLSSGLVLVLCLTDVFAFHRMDIVKQKKELQDKVDKFRQVQMIKHKILHVLGIPITEPQTTHAVPLVENIKPTPTVYRLTEVKVYHSELPENFTDDHIIQFKFPSQTNEKMPEIASVNLLVRVKLKRKKSSTSTRDKRSMAGPKKKDSSRRKEENAKRHSKHEKRKSERRRKQKNNKLEIRLLVSNITDKGQPSNVLADVNASLKKTKMFNIALPKDSIQRNNVFPNTTVLFHVQCMGCGRKASLILIHRTRKRKRANSKRKNRSRFLHKRRPKLFVETRVTPSLPKS